MDYISGLNEGLMEHWKTKIIYGSGLHVHGDIYLNNIILDRVFDVIIYYVYPRMLLYYNEPLLFYYHET